MTPQEFIAKWKRATLKERSAAQEHFIDLCRVLGQPTPAQADPDGAWYCFEKGVKKLGGGKGWADVWMRQHFAWEYKGKHKDLGEAYQQLQLYRENLDNPPLLVVCDLDRFEVHTNFTNTATKIHSWDLDGLGEPANLDVLRKLFTDPDALKPAQTTEEVTKEVAEYFAELADGMRSRQVPAERAAHFLMKLMFCMFAEDIGLLPEKLFSKVLTGSKDQPAALTRKLKNLFGAMCEGGEFGVDTILHFNGGLFADADVEELTADEIDELIRANEKDWSNVEPSIFGTLFERTLDPAKRSQIGAHYTSKEDILTLLEPVLMTPLRREWEDVKEKCEKLWVKAQEALRQKAAKAKKVDPGRRVEVKAGRDLEKTIHDFAERLAHVTVLDPACGSGNFLYVAIKLLLDLEKQVIVYASQRNVTLAPQVRPPQLAGIEINPYAQQLAQVVIWIGYLQWKHHNGFWRQSDPVLDPIENIRRMDAILDLADPKKPKEPEWPDAEFIVSNPPFLGNKRMRSELGEDYCKILWECYADCIPPMSDLCCYWFEKARAMIKNGKARQVGLLATTAIKQVGARHVLERISESCKIIFAISDQDWTLDGASVRISMVGFSARPDAGTAILDGKEVSHINPDLGAGLDLTHTKALSANLGLCFMGVTKVGDFDIEHETACNLLKLPNPNGCPNSDVLRPLRNGSDLVRVSSDRWIIDFGVEMAMEQAAFYEGPFNHLTTHVKPERERNTQVSCREKWWIHARSRPDFRNAVHGHPRYIGTARIAKHRVFVWLDSVILPDSKVIAITRSDYSSLGILQSRLHEIWTLAKCGWHGLGNDATYNPTACFETFPFPTLSEDHKAAIAAAAEGLDTLRNNWLNPSEWTRQEVLEFPGSVKGPWARYVHDPDLRGIGTVRYPRIVPKDADCAKDLQKRTLTNLYNERPTWLDLAHKKLDEAVFAAYGWKPDMSDEQILEALLALNLQRAKSAS